MEPIVTVKGQVSHSINFAMQQNYVPIIRSIIVTNEGEEELESLTVSVHFEPAFAKEYSYIIGKIAPGQSQVINPVVIQLSTEFLFSLTERMVGAVEIVIYQGEEKLSHASYEIELLAYDQWSGIQVMPELISAFVTPNHPSIIRVLNTATEYLMKWSKRPEFTAYQTRNPDCVKQQMAAIYAALQQEAIVYMNPLANYEEVGQRIRLPHVVLQQKQGTCLDLAVLYAACLEAVGLFPLLILQKEHAYAGCFLDEETFADSVVDDVSALEKRTQEGAEEVLLVECTDYVVSKKCTFEEALKHGKEKLTGQGEFFYAIDIKRARGSGIRPIPVQLDQTVDLEKDNDFCGEKARVLAPKPMERVYDDLTPEEEKTISKQKIWERKLLDFSLRNTLLNFRVTRNAIQFMTTNLDDLENQISEGKDYRIMEAPEEGNLDLRDTRMFELEHGQELIESIVENEFKNGRLRTFLSEKELEKDLKILHRSAKESLEENGSNTLYLALGFLRWYESDIAQKPRYAPIVLLPIDLVRNTKDKGYLIRTRQEEAQVNITLLEYIRQDFDVTISGLDPLPMDEHGINLSLVFHKITQGIMGKNRWGIEKKAFMGIFSFGQFVMWNDIRNRSKDLEENKVVSSLIEGKMNWNDQGTLLLAESLDEKIRPDDIAVPLSADSSQMTAIVAAASGKSFVLHGAPGTGKSQTITNMIATLLYQGKSVLFVAEKMAALNVVQKRLASIGLAPFCLELHSNKTSKSAVLSQLERALEVGKVKSPEEYETTAEKIHILKEKLNEVVEAIHCKRQYGCSLYEAIERFEQNHGQKDKIHIRKEDIAFINPEKINAWMEQIREYAVTAREIGEYKTNPLLGYEGCEYSIELREQLKEDIESAIDCLDKTKESIDWVEAFSKRTANRSKKELELMLYLCCIALTPAQTLPALSMSQNYEERKSLIRELMQAGMEYNRLYGEISKQFNEQVFSYPVNDAILRWKSAESSWFLPKMIQQSKLMKELRQYAKNPQMITKETIVRYYEQMEQLQKQQTILNNVPKEVTEDMSGLYMGTRTNWKQLSDALEKTESVRLMIKGLPREEQEALVEATVNVPNEAVVRKHRDQLQMLFKVFDSLTETYHINFSEQEKGSCNWTEEVRNVLERYAANLSQLRAFVSYRQKEVMLQKNGLSNVVEAFRKGTVSADQLMSAFTCNLYYVLVLQTISADDRLGRFQGKQYEDMIKQYKELLVEFENLTIQELVSKLSAKVPVTDMESVSSSELGILKRAIKSRGRMMSIRKLFNQIPTLLGKLCPCMLMSPISVAQYIDPSFKKFDLVIFDEASQLPTCEAVGTIARGENVVVVGDPKQLPPTSFFLSNRIDEENCEHEDLESLLDDCLAISMPQEYLKWHYRSRHESLIAFSNRNYYDDKLYTFPSPNDLVSEVKLVHVDGYYDKGKTKQNKEEAKAVVAEIIRRLSSEELRNDSIGVVTFSSVQQNLIDDLLAEEFAKHPELEDIDRNSNEPIFIKNLENVQGDERDIILFSVGYGPDQNGNVSMNFGPLNRDGGWRRLNVAISRARKEMIVYAVIRPEQIDLSRTRAEGLAGLKGFLEFAERGKNVLAVNANTALQREDAVVEEIASAIRKMGYEVKCSIGCSEYKLDLAVVNPKDKETYLLGILLDGETCRKAVTAKDRFILQQQVLTGLGWNTMRVWVLEWFDNPENVKKEIQKKIECLLEKETAPLEKKPVTTMPVKNIQFELLQESEETRSEKQPYHSVELSIQGNANDFYNSASMEQIRISAKKVLEKEAPISRKLLMRKVLTAWGITRTGKRVETIFDMALAGIEKRVTKDKESLFYWLPTQNPKEYKGYRVEDQFQNRRTMDDIASFEILNAIKEVLLEEVGVNEKDLLRLTAKKFGFTRNGTVITNAVGTAIELGVQEDILLRDERGKIVLNEKLVFI